MRIAIGLYPGLTALDFVGPYQVFTQVPGDEVLLCAERAGRLDDDQGLLHVEVEHTFADVPDPDVLVIPGGLISRKIARDKGPIIDWIRTAHEATTVTSSVCTGALLLGSAGVLTGLPATTHWVAYDALAGYGAQPTEQRVVEAGKVITAAGVSAGIDMALTVVGRLHGDDMAKAVQLGIEYDPQPPYDAGAPSKAPTEIYALVEAVIREAERKLGAA